MQRGQEIRSNEFHGVRLYVGTAPYGREFAATADTFAEVCAWFDAQEAAGWQAW
jgi:hypothetical protein